MTLIILGALMQTQDPEVKIRHPWAGFGVGSQIVVNTSVAVDGEITSESKKGHTIIEADYTRVLISILDGVGRTELVEVSLKPAHEDATIVDKGTETIEAAGRTFECRVREFALGGQTVTSWLSADSPDGLVKLVGRGEETETVTVLEAIDREADVGKIKVNCWVTHTTITSPAGTKSITRWQSHEVPGFNVRVETVETRDGVETTTTEQVVSSHPK